MNYLDRFFIYLIINISLISNSYTTRAKELKNTAIKDVNKLENYIVHIGVGQFHRSHQAVYLNDLLKKNKKQSWGIIGVNMLPIDKEFNFKMNKQNSNYSVFAVDQKNSSLQIVTSIIETIDAIENKGKALQYLEDKKTRIVSLTVTEKGYFLDEFNRLNAFHPQIEYDLKNFHSPTTPIGIIARGLWLRRESNIQAFTVMSCDNLVANGDLIRQAVIDFAEQIEPSFSSWIKENVAFPNSMVDRITPLADSEHINWLKAEHNIDDEAPVICEPFKQWVIEDRFSNTRPALEEVGVQFVDDIAAFEKMKIGLLNGGHSALAYKALLKGYARVDEAMQDPEIVEFLKRYWKSISLSLQLPQGESFENYIQVLIDRFKNPVIKDSLLRLAQDGSKKWQQSLLPYLEWCHTENAHASQAVMEAIAAWIQYLKLQVEENEKIQDPLRDFIGESFLKYDSAGVTDVILEKVFSSYAKVISSNQE